MILGVVAWRVGRPSKWAISRLISTLEGVPIGVMRQVYTITTNSSPDPPSGPFG